MAKVTREGLLRGRLRHETVAVPEWKDTLGFDEAEVWELDALTKDKVEAQVQANPDMSANAVLRIFGRACMGDESGPFNLTADEARAISGVALERCGEVAVRLNVRTREAAEKIQGNS